MRRNLCLVAAGSLLIQPAFVAAQSSKAQRDRELHEIVFQNYPPRALKAGEEGPVFFTVTLDKDASPMTCQVTHGSGHPLLDEETCDLIVQHAVFKAARGPDGRSKREAVEGVVNWTLPGHTPAPINLGALATASKPEPQVCRKNVRMGTLSSVERICMTPSQWAKQGDEMKQVYEDMQGKKGMTSEGMCLGLACDSPAMLGSMKTPAPQ